MADVIPEGTRPAAHRTAGSARRRRDRARGAFERYSFDLIYARPGQTPEKWRDELKRAISEAAEHLSLYQLTIEQDTPFAALHAAGKLKIPDDDLARTLYDTTLDVTAGAQGLPAYEISNHARVGAECRHNLVYWRYNEYAGIGPGAHGRLLVDGTRHATATERRPESWLMRVEATRSTALPSDETLTRAEQADEYPADAAFGFCRRNRPEALRGVLGPRRSTQGAHRRAAMPKALSRKRRMAACASPRRAFRSSTRWWRIWRREIVGAAFFLNCQA